MWPQALKAFVAPQILFLKNLEADARATVLKQARNPAKTKIQ